MHKTHNRAGATGCNPAFGIFGYPFYGRASAGHWGGPFRRPKYNVPINIADNETNYEVYVYALGFGKEDINISVTDDLLHITGTRTIDEATKPNFSRQEYPIKLFERVVGLNGQVDTENISARQEDGVLIVTLPKATDTQKPIQEITIL